MKTAIYIVGVISGAGAAYALTQGNYGLAIHNGINIGLFAFINRCYG